MSSLYRQAIKSLVPDGTEFENIVDHEGGKITKWKSPEVPQPSNEAIQAKIKELETDFDAKKYQRDRAISYPEIGDQLDMLWHAIDSGTLDKESDFYTTLKKVKDDNPKP